MPDTIIKVENLSKKYIIGHQRQQRYTALRDVITQGARDLGRKLLSPFSKAQASTTEEFFALKDVSFEIKQGDRVGIIGRNGAGKSTLLKILSRITEPTSGRIELTGRVASLLEVGTGFHPELTGRENIYLNGAILGMTRREIKRKFDEIVAFAEVEKFLDTPVKRFSSGMYIRLAFAVAAHLEPEILVVDEILAVGDIQFQKKCLGKMEQAAKEDRTVVFVSHNMGAIRSLCSRTIWLDSGRLRKLGETNAIIGEYEESMAGLFTQDACVAVRDTAVVKGSELHVTRVEALNSKDAHSTGFKYGESLVLDVGIGGQSRHSVFSAEFYIYNELGIFVCGGASGPYHGEYFNSKVRKVRIKIGPLAIPSGRYRISLSLVAGYESVRVDTWESAIVFTINECQPFKMAWDILAYREGACILQQSFHAIE